MNIVQELPLSGRATATKSELLRCEHCGQPFEPRQHGGGKPRKFCSDRCRSAHHAGCNPPSNPTSNATPPGGIPVESGGNGDEPTVEQRRAMLIRASEEFGPRQPGEPPIEQSVDRVLATAAADKAALERDLRETQLIRSQDAITIEHDETTGEWIIRQKNWPDDDGEIYINEESIHEFIDKLTDALGYGGSAP